jgi:hypothetical protein
MYKIYYDNTLIFYDKTPIEELKLIDPTLALEKNEPGSLTFTLPMSNLGYNIIQRKRGVVKVTKNGSEIWRGRVLSEDYDFQNNKTITCEGELAFLNDTMQPQHVYKGITLRQYIESILSIHNQKVDDTKKFQVGIVTVTNNAGIGTRTTSFESTWSTLKKLEDEFKGYFIVRLDGNTRYLDYRSECPRRSDQIIEFGVNLIDFTRSYNLSSLATVVLPLGKKLASGGQTAIGEELKTDASGNPVTIAQGYWIDGETKNISHDDPPKETSKDLYATTSYIDVEAEKTYYLSSRNGQGRVMYVLKDSNGNIVDMKTSSSGEVFTDMVEMKLTIPKSEAGNKYKLAVAGYGQDIKCRINASIAPDENLDAYVTIEDVNNGSAYVVNQDAVTTYGWIEKQMTWDEIDNKSQLKEAAERYITEGQFDEMSIEATAVDLQSIGVDADKIGLLDECHVVSKPHGLDKIFPVTKLEIKLASPQDNRFTLGEEVTQTLTGISSTSTHDIYNKIASVPSITSTLKSAQENASMLINNALSGQVNFVQDDKGNIVEIRITKDGYDWRSESAVGWKINSEGIAYFPKGFNQNVSIALTGKDGGLVANAITSGYLSGDVIRGGTLDLGHVPLDDGKYIDGSLAIYDSTGQDYMLQINKNGAFFKGNTQGIENNLQIVDGWLRGREGSVTGISLDTQHDNKNSITINAPWLELYVQDINVHAYGSSGEHIDTGVDGYVTVIGSTTQYFQFSKGIFVGLADHPWGRQVASIQL